MPTSLLVDRVKILVQSSGVGPFSLGAAIPSFRGLEALVNGQTYSYVVASDSLYEVGTGMFLSSGTQFTRVPEISSNGGAAVPFPAGVQLVFTARAADFAAAAGGGGSDPTVTVLASEAIATGNFINIYGDGVSSVVRARKAVASDPAKFCNGFCLGAIGSAGTGIATVSGLNTGAVPTLSQSQVWLSDTPGGFTTTPPSADGHIIQSLGSAIPSVGVFFFPQPTVLL